MLARTQSGAAGAQKAPQGPAIALQAPPRAFVAPTAARTDRPVTLQTSDQAEQTALVSFVRVHWAASSALLVLWLAGFQLPVLGGLMYVTWELHAAAWLLAFVTGQ